MDIEFEASHKSILKFTAERMLLVLVGVFIGINYLALAITRSETNFTYWLGFILWIGSAIGGTILLDRFLPKRDKFLFPLAMFMSGWGLVAIERLAPRFADRQAIWLALGVASMIVVATTPYILRWLRNYRYLWLIFGLILLTSTIIFGQNPTGDSTAPQLWLGAENIFFQPSELLKIILVTFLASYLAEQYPSLRAESLLGSRRLLTLSPRIVGPILLMWGLTVVILIWQRDLGTAILFFMAFIILLYVASGYWFILVSGGLLILIAGIVAYFAFDVVQLRVDIWLNPWADADGRAFQIVQSLQAFSAGGIFGEGIGQGSPTYVPVVHSDFIFSAIGEEWGLVGGVVIIACFAIFTLRGIQIASIQKERAFYALIGIGLTALITIQSMLIMGGVLRIIPLTGVTLPFFSYGGSSLLISFIIVGLLLRLSTSGNK